MWEVQLLQKLSTADPQGAVFLLWVGAPAHIKKRAEARF
ncbi:MAG: hypothetical protein ACJAWL_002660 [Motiliproteus sp.]|jgi:hypothetical protein